MRLRRLCEYKAKSKKCHVDQKTHEMWKGGGEGREWLEIFGDCLNRDTGENGGMSEEPTQKTESYLVAIFISFLQHTSANSPPFLVFLILPESINISLRATH